MRYLFIVNPISGRGEGKRKWEEIKIEAQNVGLNFQVVFTTKPGEGVFLAEEGVRAGYDVLVAVGGDGTINEVIHGRIKADQSNHVKIGIIPAGTGNDLVRTLDIPFETSQAVQVLKDAQVQLVDLGKVNGDHFINVVGIGFDGAVAYEINERVKWLKGTLAYIYGVLKTLITYNCPQMTIDIDGEEITDRFLLVAIANGKYYGGGMMIAPDADPTDGFFDIIVVKKVSKLEVLKFFPKIFKGNHIDHPMLKIYHGKKVHVRSSERVLIQADGELKGTAPLGFEVIAKRLPILVPGER